MKKKEFERRHTGQEMSKAKHNREAKQAQDIMNQIKEDKAKERAHREAVRQQIARDKAEREARRQNELQERQHAQASVASSAAVSGGSDRQPKSEWLVLCPCFLLLLRCLNTVCVRFTGSVNYAIK